MGGALARVGFVVAAVLLSLLVARCGLIRSHPPLAEPRDIPTQSSAEQLSPEAPPPAPQPEVVPAPAAAAAPAVPQPAVEPTPTPPQSAPVVTAPRETQTPSQPTAKRHVTKPQPAEAASATPAQPARKNAAPAAKAPVPAAPLDLSGLKQELKETKAIGVFSKLTLKNQMDDLLSALRKFHQGKGKDTLADLHRSYELLVMKVLSLVQDDDKKLASDIVSSREAIWGILADPKKFAALQL